MFFRYIMGQSISQGYVFILAQDEDNAVFRNHSFGGIDPYIIRPKRPNRAIARDS